MPPPVRLRTGRVLATSVAVVAGLLGCGSGGVPEVTTPATPAVRGVVTDLEILESGDVSFTLTVFNDSPRSVTGLSCEVGVVNSNTVELGSTVVDGFGDIGAGESLVAASAVQLPLGAADTTVRGVARCDGQAR